MLEKLAPQKVIDRESGYTVQVANRFTMEYIEGRRKASVEVDFGKTVGVYSETLKFCKLGDEKLIISDIDKKKILDRIKRALEFMGSQVELC